MKRAQGKGNPSKFKVNDHDISEDESSYKQFNNSASGDGRSYENDFPSYDTSFENSLVTDKSLSPNTTGSGNEMISPKQQIPMTDPKNCYKTHANTSNASNLSDSFEQHHDKKLESRGPSIFEHFCVITLITIIISMILCFGLFHKVNYKISTPKKNCSDLLDLNKIFPMESPTFWKEILVGIEHVQNDEPPQPAVFLFVYSDKNLAKNVINRLIERVNLCLDSIGGFLTITSQELQSQKVIKDYGTLIDKYKPILENKRVMLVEDVQLIPAAVAPAFHVFCDTSSPVVKKSAIIFTLHADEDQIPKVKNELYDYVENRLSELWKDGVHKDKIQPLITRMTDNVLPLKIKS
uniref:CSON008516 protein n=1 Tax=Culicoides sonorensis TaxID=179676 RepID=A0A336LD71_CULSO